MLGAMPILGELARRTSNFIQACITIDSDTIRSSTNVSSSLGRNAYVCCTRFSSKLNNINNLNRSTNNQCAGELLSTNDYYRVELIRELLQVRSSGLVLPGPEFIFGHHRHDRLASISLKYRELCKVASLSFFVG